MIISLVFANGKTNSLEEHSSGDYHFRTFPTQ